MKGELMLKMLEQIQNVSQDAEDLLAAFLNAGYGASYRKLEKEFFKQKQLRNKRERELMLKQKYYNLLYRLKKDGFIVESQKHHKKFFNLTKRGKQTLEILNDKFNTRLPDAVYSGSGIKALTIVCFDIPENERRKRNWLRAVLKNLDFSMVQKSVWIGKTKIPEILFNDLAALKLLDYIEIFEVSKTGSLNRLT